MIQSAPGRSGQGSRRVRGVSRRAPAAVAAPGGRDRSPVSRGVGRTTATTGRFIRRGPGGTTAMVGGANRPAPSASSTRQRSRSRIVDVREPRADVAATGSGAIRVGASARRATARRPGSGIQTTSATRVGSAVPSSADRAGSVRGVENATSGVVTSAPPNRRPGGRIDVTGRAVPRPPIAASPSYGNRGGGYGASYGRYAGSGYRTSPRYAYRYPYRGGRVRFARAHSYYYYPYYHYRFPGYRRPRVYGSFFYFPGYGFNVGFGTGYPAAFGHYGYSGYAYAPYGYVGYNPRPSHADPYTGFLRLKVQPRDAQVFVDGAYVGLVDHFDGFAQRLRLEEGTHRIEIRHPQYVPIEFEVLIVTGEKVTFEERMVPY